jgi:hypothetical protein
MIDADASLDLGKGLEDVAQFALSIPLSTESGLVGVLTRTHPGRLDISSRLPWK